MTNKNDTKSATLKELIGSHQQKRTAHNAACTAADEVEIALTWGEKPALTIEQAASIKALITIRDRAGTAERKALTAICSYSCRSMAEISTKAAYLNSLADHDNLAIEPHQYRLVVASLAEQEAA